ncbi:GNAT family N-acetyltransferase [Shewanella algae]|uniref:GNAT family N-acetyltransferase n=1 Tax=Shewanella algae TaxID=38313 RepID=UPI003006BE2C|nr:GNAT family N-acetyltransferase [Shewanella algae]
MMLEFTPQSQLSASMATAADTAFIQKVFNSCHSYFLHLGLPEEMAQVLLLQQFQLQQAWFQNHYPNAITQILRVQEQAAGILTLNTGTEALHILDMAFLPEYRGQGLGSELLNAIQSLAQLKAVSLMVARDNPQAKKLYLNKGFVTQNVTETHEWMRWHCH